MYQWVEMLRILTIAVRQQEYQKRSKFGYYFRFPSLSFLSEKPLDFICAS